MKASKLIELLAQQIQAHGDCEVVKEIDGKTEPIQGMTLIPAKYQPLRLY